MSDNSPSEIKQLAEDLNSTFEHMKGALEQQDAEIKKYGEVAGETKGAIEQINARLDATEDLVGKMTAPGLQGDEPGADAEKAAFIDWMKKGHNASPDSIKALSRGTDTAGGVMIPEPLSNELLKNLVEISDVRRIASSTQISSGDSLTIRKRTSEAAAGWTGEQDSRSESTNPAFGKERIPLHEQYIMVDISHQLLDMSDFNFEQEWMSEATEQGAKLEGAAFVTGALATRPKGFATSTSGVTATNSTEAATFGADALMKLPDDIKDAYSQNGIYAFNRATRKHIRTLKDGNGQYLWTPGLGDAFSQGIPATVNGYSYVILQDMPDIGANAFPVAFGDFKRGYRIVDLTKMRQIRDDVTQASTGFVRFWVHRYVGGQVVLPEALRLLKCAA